MDGGDTVLLGLTEEGIALICAFILIEALVKDGYMGILLLLVRLLVYDCWCCRIAVVVCGRKLVRGIS